jgi:hypothetical protein
MALEATVELVRERYRIVGKLGEGSQGTTFDGVDQNTGTPVAIKRFVVKGSQSWKDVELAEREATVLEALSHPSLPAHVDHFEENGALYLVMQKIEGESIASLTKRGGMLSQQDVMRFLSDAAAVLDYLHRRSPPVIHRDINPKNVIRRPDGSFAIVDFGAVRDKLKPEGGSTVVGTFGYMATEQFQGRALPASDVYSVGATAIRMLTGTEPENLPHKGLGIDVHATLGRSVDRELVNVLSRMLDPDPDRRATSITPLLEKLERATARGPAFKSNRHEHDSARTEVRSRKKNRGRRWDFDDVYEAARERAREVREDAEEAAYEAARQAARDAREGAAHAAHDARHEARRMSREARRRARRMRGMQRRGWRGPFLPAAIALNLAILVVGIMLGGVVPFVLVLLSIFFGPQLRDAARRVREAGHKTQRALAHAQAVMMGDATLDATEDAKMRVEADEASAPPPRARVAIDQDEDVVDTVGTEVDNEERAHRR